MITVELAGGNDLPSVERLIAAYHASEGIKPNAARISWAIDQCMSHGVPSLLLVARQESMIVGVALAVYSPSAELGKVLTVNDFYVDSNARRHGVGTALATKLMAEARKNGADRIDLEVLPRNTTAVAFWKSVGFQTFGRTVYSLNLNR